MESAGSFPTTAWTLVLSAGRRTEPENSQALASLCEKYWYPLYAYIRRRGYPVEQAQDLTQEFFARVIEKRYIARADRTKGRFRSFLLSSLRYFLFDDVDRRRALKRGGSRALISFEIGAAEERYQREPAHGETPEKIFERRWALALLERVMERLRGELERDGKDGHFDRLKTYLIGGDTHTPYVELAVEMQTTEGALKVAIHRLRKRYRQLLREEIAETVAEPAEIEEEIRYLAGVLAMK